MASARKVSTVVRVPPKPSPPPSSRVRAVLEHLRVSGFPGLVLRAPLGGGSNENWAASGQGLGSVLKVYLDSLDETAETLRLQEVRALDLWAHVDAVPRVLFSAADPYPHLLTGLVPGRPVAPADVLDVTPQVAELLRTLHGAGGTPDGRWPALLSGWLDQTPARLRSRNAEHAALVAEYTLEVLAEQPAAVLHGDAAPWNVLADNPPRGTQRTATLLDPMARSGPAAFDLARWCVTAALSRLWPHDPAEDSAYSCGAPDSQGDQGSSILRADLALLEHAAMDGYGPLDPLAVREAIVLELLNRASFGDWRWPEGYETVLLNAAFELTRHAR